MKIVSWNLNGLRSTIKNGYFDMLFKKYRPDIICFQETKAEKAQLKEEYQNYKNYYSYFSHSKKRKGYSGVAIYTKEKPLKIFEGMRAHLPKKKVKEFDDEGRLLTLVYKKFILITGYYPNGGSGPDRLKYKLAFYDTFLEYILKLRKENKKIIFCGDINTAHNAIDLARPKANEGNTGFLPIERAWIDKVIKNNFIDIWRERNINKKDMYTYWDQKTASRERNVGWRLDYFFIDKTLEKNIKNAGMYTNYKGSDHCPIFIDINI